jgi:polyisoprenoid-binding protein YceI
MNYTRNKDRLNQSAFPERRSPDFFDVAKFPTIAFKSVSVTKVAEGKRDITDDPAVRLSAWARPRRPR